MIYAFNDWVQVSEVHSHVYATRTPGYQKAAMVSAEHCTAHPVAIQTLLHRAGALCPAETNITYLRLYFTFETWAFSDTCKWSCHHLRHKSHTSGSGCFALRSHIEVFDRSLACQQLQKKDETRIASASERVSACQANNLSKLNTESDLWAASSALELFQLPNVDLRMQTAIMKCSLQICMLIHVRALPLCLIRATTYTKRRVGSI